MRTSRVVAIPLLLGFAGCSRDPIDPCSKDHFAADRCREASAHGGFLYYGSWHPQTYDRPYTYYETQAKSFAEAGGRVTPMPESAYAPEGGARGAFGSSGEAAGEASGHGGGGGEGGE